MPRRRTGSQNSHNATNASSRPSWYRKKQRSKAGAATPTGWDWSKISSAITSLAALGALLFTALSLQQTRFQNQITESGQITDRINAAIANLGSDNMEIRIGGAYALRRIMEDSTRDQPAVVEILVAFVRQHVPAAQAAPNPDSDHFSAMVQPTIPMDIQAALTVLGSRKQKYDNGVRIDFDSLNLSGANFDGLDFSKANFRDADLNSSYFNNAMLVGAHFDAANLQYAAFDSAVLKGASLSDANLYRATLLGADVRDSELDGADLTNSLASGANLHNANLSFAFLRGTDFSDANLGGALFQSADIESVVFRGSDLTGTTVARAASCPTAYTNVKGAIACSAAWQDGSQALRVTPAPSAR